MIAIINLLTNIFITGTSIIGSITIVNKIGNFCKILDKSQNDGFKLAFDNLMMETIDDMNKCVESITNIGGNLNNAIFILYDVMTGNKYIKKNKDGKIIICGKTKLYSGYKEKIDELTSKVKKYEDEINKMKNASIKKNIKTNIHKINTDENDNDSSSNTSDNDDNNSHDDNDFSLETS